MEEVVESSRLIYRAQEMSLAGMNRVEQASFMSSRSWIRTQSTEKKGNSSHLS